jgi:hypothetical protein
MRFALLVALVPLIARASPHAILGRYHYSGDTAERQQIRQAVDDTVNHMTPIARRFADKRLRVATSPTAELEIVVEGKDIVVRRPGRSEVRTPADGSTGKWRDAHGDWFAVSQHVVGRVLYQRIDDKRSHTLNRYIIDDNGHLTVDCSTWSRHMPVPLRYHTTYERAD